ncbi:MAG: hypothetical protein ACYSW3_00415 [Planctomycetota bacterium]
MDEKTPKDFSTDQLEAELRRRREEIYRLERPQRVNQPDWNPLARMIDEYIDDLYHKQQPGKDLDTYVFEAAVVALYGKDVWPWIRQRLNEVG